MREPRRARSGKERTRASVGYLAEVPDDEVAEPCSLTQRQLVLPSPSRHTHVQLVWRIKVDPVHLWREW